MRFPISFWNTTNLDDAMPNTVETWHELGITLAMSPSYKREDSKRLLDLLNKAHELAIKVILCDYRTHWHVMNHKGEEEYKRLAIEAQEEYGKHPAVYGFFIGDEPDADNIENALKAMRIHQELSSELVAYLNLLPWFDWIGERMGTPALAPYLDRVKNEGKAAILSYDCYTQMWEGESGYDVYFNNLREYYEATKRLDTPFWNIVLSCGHYYYRCPSKDDFTWQLSTSIAHGAKGLSWFYIHQPDTWENYRNAPINPLGQKTQAFYELSEVNRLFLETYADIMMDLKIDQCFHVEKAYGGNKLFESFGNILSVSSEKKIPLIFSSFKDEAGRNYYILCCNSPTNSTLATVKITENVQLEQCRLKGNFVPVRAHTDPIGFREGQTSQSVNIWLGPGQAVLLRERA